MPNGMEYENDDLFRGLRQVTYASMDQARDTLAGAQYGAQNLAATSVLGAQQLVSDVGRLIPDNPLPNMHPFVAVRHGMYSHGMSLTGDIAAMFGRGTPDTTTGYEYQELAARDFGQRVTNATAAAGMYGGGLIGGTLVGGKMLTSGAKAGFSAGKAVAAARGAGMIGKGLMAGGGAIAGGLPGIAAYMAMDMTVGKIMDDVADRQDVMNFLEASSFRYIQGQGEDVDDRFGAGFNRSARGKIAESIKQIDLQDPRYNMEDLKGVLEKGTELGMFTGTRDAQDFSQKFKDLTSNLKQVTKILHQSLNDGMETLKSLKEIGISSPTGVSAAIQHADILGTATGKTAAEMLSIGRQGAEMVRGTGVSLGTGASMMQQTFAMMGSASDAGTLDPELVAQGGGVAALSQKVMARHLQNLNTNFGKGAMLSILGPGGEIDANKLDQLASGQMGLGQMFRGASQNVSTPGGYVDAVINRDSNLRKVTSQYGGMGGAMVSMGMELTQAKELTGFTGRSVRDTAKFLALQRGETEAEFEARYAIVDNVDEYEKKQQAAMEVSIRKARGETLREMTDFGAILGDKFDRLINPISTRVGRTIDAVSGSISDAYRSAADTITEKITGVRTVQAQKISDEDLAQIFIQNKGNLDIKRSKYEDQLGTYGYSEGDLKTFEEKSEKFKELDKDFIEKMRDPDAFKKMGQGAESFAKFLFSKPLKDLTRDERMFLENKSKQYAPKTAEELKRKRLEAQKKLRDRYADSLSANKEDTDLIKVELEDAREDIGEFAIFHAFSEAKDLIENVYDNADKDPQAARNLDDIITASGDERRFLRNLKKETSKPKSEQNPERIKKLRDKLKKVRETKEDAKLSLGEKIKDPEGLGQLLEGLDSTKSEDLINLTLNLSDTRKRLDRSVQGDKETQIKESLRSRFRLIGDTVKKGLLGKGASDQRKDLDKYLGNIAEGKELSKSDIEDLGDISKKSGSAELAGITNTVMKIKEAAQGGKLSDTKKLEKFMTQRGMIPKSYLDDPKKKTEFLEAFFDKNKVQAEKLIQWEIATTKADRAGGTRFSGGRVNERILESEKQTMEGLSQVQMNTAHIIEQLTRLSLQLEDRMKGK